MAGLLPGLAICFRDEGPLLAIYIYICSMLCILRLWLQCVSLMLRADVFGGGLANQKELGSLLRVNAMYSAMQKLASVSAERGLWRLS